MSSTMTTTSSPSPASNSASLGNQSLGNNSSEENRNGFEVENPLLENLEEILMELTNFERESSKASSFLEVTIPPQLETYLKAVAEVGTTQFPWNKIKPLFRVKLEQVISELNNSSQASEIPPAPNVDPFNFDAIKTKVFEQLDAFIGIPFTVQRLAELITSPRKHYRRTDKFMRALEKNMLVVSTVEARDPSPNILGSVSEAGQSSTSHGVINGNDHNVLPTSHLRRSQSPTSTGFVKSNRPSDSPTKETDSKGDAKDVDLSQRSNSNEEDKENINLRESENKTPDSSESVSPNGSDESQINLASKSSELDTKSGKKSDHHEGMSIDDEDTTKPCDGIPKQGSNKSDLASSSSDVSEVTDNESLKSCSESSVGSSSLSGAQAQKPDDGRPSSEDNGPCDSAEGNQNVSSAQNSKDDDMQVGSSEIQSSSGNNVNKTETKENLSDQTNILPSSGQDSYPTTSDGKEPVGTQDPAEVDKMEVDVECTSTETPILTSS